MTTPGRQLAYPETRCREDLTNVIALIHLGFLDAKDYPQISPDLEIRPPPEKEMNTKEKIVFYSLCFLIFAGLGVGIFYIACKCSNKTSRFLLIKVIQLYFYLSALLLRHQHGQISVPRRSIFGQLVLRSGLYRKPIELL